MNKKYVVHLTEAEREHLEKLVRHGRAHARKLLYARILLKTDVEGSDRWTDERITEALEVSTATVARQRRRYCEDGLEVALMPKKPGKPRRRVLDGRAEAHLIALSCSDSPEGRERWSMRLLADRMVELGHVESVFYETVRRTLKKLPQATPEEAVGKIPPRKSAAFVWRMEEVLDLYEEPYDPLRPVVRFDERPCQLIGEVREPLPMKPGHVERFDSEYERGGVCWVSMSFETQQTPPQIGRAHV